MAYTVAQAEVTVTPNARNFGEDLKAVIGPQADAIGREAGDRIGKQIQERVRLALAELPDAKIGVDTKASGAEVDRFVRDVDSKVKTGVRKTGDDSGGLMAEGFRLSFLRNSPLIAAAVAGGLIAGAPLVAAAGVTLMGGLAAAILHSDPEVKAAAVQVVDSFSTEFTKVAQVDIPFLTTALGNVALAAHSLAAEAAPAFAALGTPIRLLTTGVLELAHNAMPGLVAVTQTAGPVFQGLADLLAGIGSGLSDLFTTISQHAAAAGQTFSSLGSILHTLLDALGTLAGAGAELGATVLPVLASALQAVATALQIVSPILPGVVEAFLAFKAASVVGDLLGSLAAGLENIGARAMVAVAGLTGVEAAGMAAGTGFEAAAAGARGLEAAMGPIGIALAVVSLAVPLLTHLFGDNGEAAQRTAGAVQSYTSALEANKGAIDGATRAAAAKAAQDSGLLGVAQRLHIPLTQVTTAITDQGSALDDTRAALQANIAAHTHWVVAGHTAVATLDAEGQASKTALGALNQLAGTTTRTQANQRQLAAATQGAADATQTNSDRLQELAKTANAAGQEINLLKLDLDQLTGKAVTLDQAEIGVTNAVQAVTDAVKSHTAELKFNGAELDLSNTKSAQAASLLMTLASNSKQVTATMEQQGATTQQVTAYTDQARAEFIRQAEQLGATAAQAKALADRYLGIPKDVHTKISADTADATAKAAAFKALVDSIHDRTVTITTRSVMPDLNGAASGSGRMGTFADGGLVRAYAGGGVEPNMPGGIAQIVPPQTFRVIGDRVTDDEAYIPINSSARSLAILAQTAGRMGYGLRPASAPAGAGKTDARNYTFNISAPSDPKAIARQIRDAQRDLEFLHG